MCITCDYMRDVRILSKIYSAILLQQQNHNQTSTIRRSEIREEEDRRQCNMIFYQLVAASQCIQKQETTNNRIKIDPFIRGTCNEKQDTSKMPLWSWKLKFRGMCRCCFFDSGLIHQLLRDRSQSCLEGFTIFYYWITRLVDRRSLKRRARNSVLERFTDVGCRGRDNFWWVGKCQQKILSLVSQNLLFLSIQDSERPFQKLLVKYLDIVQNMVIGIVNLSVLVKEKYSRNLQDLFEDIVPWVVVFLTPSE